MNPDILLAKGFAENGDFNDAEKTRRLSLTFHSQAVYEAAREIFDATADAQLTALGLAPEKYRDRFRRILLAAAALHDLGKANSLFQGAVRGDDCGQSLRHEWILYFLLRFTKLGEFVRRAFPEETRDRDFQYLVWAVAAHHLKEAGEEVSPTGGFDGKLLLDRPEIREILRRFAETFDVQTSPDESAFKFLKTLDETPLPPTADGDELTLGEMLEQPGVKNGQLSSDVAEFANDAEEAAKSEEASEEIAFAAAIRSSLIAADVAASAAGDLKSGFSTDEIGERVRDWIQKTLGEIASPEQIQKIVEHKNSALEEQKKANPTDEKIAAQRAKFQDEVEAAAPKNRVALCVAGCGAGKTLAAWRWIRAASFPNGARVFFCYPTTGTASSGYGDYLVAAGPDEVELLGALYHSRADVDFELDATLRAAKNASDDEDRADATMQTLRRWNSPIVCCTVDVVLSFLAGSYSGTLLWPALAQGVFVFDEIHSFDETLFAYLLDFIKTVRGAKILLMTASLPKERLKRLQECLEEQNDELKIVEGPRDWEEIKRYRRRESSKAPEKIVAKRFQKGEKILWVCNTVKRATDAANALKRELGAELDGKLTVYHSHFRYEDRVRRHRDCVEAFRGDGPAICVATQVAEMSLDLDADFLVSDWAPIPSLIQRLGRLNRRATTGSKPRPFLFVEPLDKNGEFFAAPYYDAVPKGGATEKTPPSWRAETERWFESLGMEPFSQRDLATRWEECAEPLPKSSENAKAVPWTATGPWARHDKYRDLNEGCEVLYFDCADESAEDVWKRISKLKRSDCVRLAIPMSKPRRKPEPPRHPKFGVYLIVGKEAAERYDFEYDSAFGGRWKSAEDDESPPEDVKGDFVV